MNVEQHSCRWSRVLTCGYSALRLGVTHWMPDVPSPDHGRVFSFRISDMHFVGQALLGQIWFGGGVSPPRESSTGRSWGMSLVFGLEMRSLLFRGRIAFAESERVDIHGP